MHEAVVGAGTGGGLCEESSSVGAGAGPGPGCGPGPDCVARATSTHARARTTPFIGGARTELAWVAATRDQFAQWIRGLRPPSL